ncbi:MAG: hypothetical protein RCG15_03810 [Candidatus Rickettsia vulgarisii]
MVISSGISAEDQVVVKGVDKLTDGVAVIVTSPPVPPNNSIK